MRTFTLATIGFAITASLFVLNRFIDVLFGAGARERIMMLGYATIPAVIIVTALVLIYRRRVLGIWILIPATCYLLVRHTMTFLALRQSHEPNAFAVPESIAHRFSITNIDIIYYAEAITGLLTLFLLIRLKHRLFPKP